MTEKNYYQILQIDPAAEPEVMQAAYKRLALKYHPDTNGSTDATQRMQEINEAYEVLSDPTRRAEYDRQRKEVVAVERRARAEQEQKRQESAWRPNDDELQRRMREAQRRAEADRIRRVQEEAQRQAKIRKQQYEARRIRLSQLEVESCQLKDKIKELDINIEQAIDLTRNNSRFIGAIAIVLLFLCISPFLFITGDIKAIFVIALCVGFPIILFWRVISSPRNLAAARGLRQQLENELMQKEREIEQYKTANVGEQ